MTIIIIILTITLTLTLIALKAQRRLNTAQSLYITELERAVHLHKTSTSLERERADTLALGLKQAHTWLSLYREQVAELEDENRMLYRVLRKRELLAILAYPRVEVQGAPAEKREIGLN